MDIETATSPVDGGDNAEATPANETEVETESQIVDQQFDAEGNLVTEAAPDDDEEVEIDPELKLKVSKAQAQKLKDAILRQADYTRKTQALAERHKALEAAAAQTQQMDEQEISAKAQLNAISQRFNQLSSIDFAGQSARINNMIAQARSAFDEDAENHWRSELAGLDTLHKEFSQLAPRHQSLSNALAQHQHQRALDAQQETARLIDQGRAELTKHVPEWNDDHKAKLVAFAASYGVSADDLSDIEANPPAARILHAAFVGAEALNKAKKAANLAAAQSVTPIPTLKGTAGKPALRADTNDFKAFEKLADTRLATK
jgi:hypothetical protein